jgi:hypothetical protein
MQYMGNFCEAISSWFSSCRRLLPSVCQSASTYRELALAALSRVFCYVESLPPEQLFFSRPGYRLIIGVLVPVVDINRLVDTGDFNDVHVVARYELALAVMELASAREVFWAIHPIYAQVNMSLASSADFENTGNPELNLAVIAAQLVWDLDEDVLVDFEFIFPNLELRQ